MDESLQISDGVVIPASELRWRFGPAGGPGGQHANRSSTRAELIFDLGASGAVPPDLKETLLANLGGRAPGGVIVVVADESRSQWRNRGIARKRLAAVLHDAARTRAERVPTRVPATVRRRRLLRKRRRSETKRLRRPPESE